MAAGVPNLVAAGATMIGGCCGTTPETIALVNAMLAGRPITAGACDAPAN
jgi:S-methylmethionine-dependent homocysteine/selenocysteine methylase